MLLRHELQMASTKPPPHSRGGSQDGRRGTHLCPSPSLPRVEDTAAAAAAKGALSAKALFFL